MSEWRTSTFGAQRSGLNQQRPWAQPVNAGTTGSVATVVVVSIEPSSVVEVEVEVEDGAVVVVVGAVVVVVGAVVVVVGAVVVEVVEVLEVVVLDTEPGCVSNAPMSGRALYPRVYGVPR